MVFPISCVHFITLFSFFLEKMLPLVNFNLFEKKEENQEKVACKLWSNFNAGR